MSPVDDFFSHRFAHASLRPPRTRGHKFGAEKFMTDQEESASAMYAQSVTESNHDLLSSYSPTISGTSVAVFVEVSAFLEFRCDCVLDW